MLCLGEVPDSVTESDVRAALAPFGTVVAVTMRLSPGAHVQMETRAMAAAAVASSDARRSVASPLTAVCGFAFIAYNERPYDALRAVRTGDDGWRMEGDGRGWCVFEAGVSTELTVRLSSYPKMKTLLDAMGRPKAFTLSRNSSPMPMESDHDAGTDGQHVKSVEMRLEAATFTGRGDKPVVLSIYRDFVQRITNMLTQTLAFNTGTADGAGDAHGEARTAAPTITLPPAPPIRLAVDTFLMSLPVAPGSAVDTSDDPTAPRLVLGVVEEDGRLTGVVERRPLQMGFDMCSQAVLPWKAPREGWSLTLLNNDLPVLAQLGELVQPVRTRGELTAKHCYEVLKPLVAGLAKLETPQLRAAARAEVERLREAPIHGDRPTPDPKNYANQEDFDFANREIATEKALRASFFAGLLDEMQSKLRAALHSLFATECTIGVRNYGEGQQLSVYLEQEASWADAEVVASYGDGKHTLKVRASRSGHKGATAGHSEVVEMALHPWNHAPRELPVTMLDKMLAWHANTMRQQHLSITDALSGKRLNVLDQLVPIGLASNHAAANNTTGNHAASCDVASDTPMAPPSDDGGLGEVRDVASLASWLHAVYTERLAGSAMQRPTCVLLTAGPAAGKTCLISQLVVHTLEINRRLLGLEVKAALVPILVRVQLLQRRLIEEEAAFSGAWNWIDAFLRVEYGAESPLYRALRQVMMARRALLLLDGIDEGGIARQRIEEHVTEVLRPQGHVMLCTSRPTGIPATWVVSNPPSAWASSCHAPLSSFRGVAGPCAPHG